MKHEVKLKGTMPRCTIYLNYNNIYKELKQCCNGQNCACRKFESDDDFEPFCNNCSYDNEIFLIKKTDNFEFDLFPTPYGDAQYLKIGRKDYSECHIEYLDVDGIVLIDKTKKEINTD